MTQAVDKPKRKLASERPAHLRAMGQVTRILEPLSEEDRRKVIRSAAALFDALEVYLPGLAPRKPGEVS